MLRDVYGCGGGIIMPGAHRTGNFHHSISVAVAKGDTGHSNSAPWSPAFHHQGVRVSLILHEPVKT